MNIEEVKNKAKNVFDRIRIETGKNDIEKQKILADIIEKEIREEDIEIILETISYIEKYFYVKKEFDIINEDAECLHNIAEKLRNQKVRVEEKNSFESPVFNITLNGYKHDFLTRDGAKKYTEFNSKILTENQEVAIEENEERRKLRLFNVTSNKNPEIERIIDIIIRNF